MKDWKASSALFSSVIVKLGGVSKTARALQVADAFIYSIQRGEKPLPARQAYRLSEITGISFQKFMEAFLKDQETAYGSAVKIPKGDS